MADMGKMWKELGRIRDFFSMKGRKGEEPDVAPGNSIEGLENLYVEDLAMQGGETFRFLVRVQEIMSDLMDNEAGLDPTLFRLEDLKWFDYMIYLGCQGRLSVISSCYDAGCGTLSVAYTVSGPDILRHSFTVPGFGGDPEHCARVFLKMCVEDYLKEGSERTARIDDEIRSLTLRRESAAERMEAVRRAYTGNGIL